MKISDETKGYLALALVCVALASLAFSVLKKKPESSKFALGERERRTECYAAHPDHLAACLDLWGLKPLK